MQPSIYVLIVVILLSLAVHVDSSWFKRRDKGSPASKKQPNPIEIVYPDSGTVFVIEESTYGAAPLPLLLKINDDQKANHLLPETVSVRLMMRRRFRRDVLVRTYGVSRSRSMAFSPIKLYLPFYSPQGAFYIELGDHKKPIAKSKIFTVLRQRPLFLFRRHDLISRMTLKRNTLGFQLKAIPRRHNHIIVKMVTVDTKVYRNPFSWRPKLQRTTVLRLTSQDCKLAFTKAIPPFEFKDGVFFEVYVSGFTGRHLIYRTRVYHQGDSSNMIKSCGRRCKRWFRRQRDKVYQVRDILGIPRLRPESESQVITQVDGPYIKKMAGRWAPNGGRRRHDPVRRSWDVTKAAFRFRVV